MTSDRKIKATVQHAIQFDGDKFVSGQAIKCAHEGCEVVERIATNNFHHRLPDDVLGKKFKRRGWVFRSGAWLCPAHGHPRKAAPRPIEPPAPSLAVVVPLIRPAPVLKAPMPPPDPIPTPKETPVVETATPLRSFGDLASAAIDKMGTSDRRRILREIMDNWDESRGRYIGAVADQSIASKLNVPRAWVQHLRVENVGDNGQNEEIEDLRADLEKAQRNFDAAADDAMKIAVRIDTLAKGIRELLARVERVEKATGVRR